MRPTSSPVGVAGERSATPSLNGSVRGVNSTPPCAPSVSAFKSRRSSFVAALGVPVVPTP
jgi:hypothetical protein